VRGAVGGVRIVRCTVSIGGVVWGREDVVVVVLVEMSRLHFRSPSFAEGGERVRAINARGERIPGESQNCDLKGGRRIRYAVDSCGR